MNNLSFSWGGLGLVRICEFLRERGIASGSHGKRRSSRRPAWRPTISSVLEMGAIYGAQAGNLAQLMAEMPVHVVKNEKVGLMGAVLTAGRMA